MTILCDVGRSLSDCIVMWVDRRCNCILRGSNRYSVSFDLDIVTSSFDDLYSI